MKALTKNVDGVDRPLYLLRDSRDKSVIIARTLSNTLGLPTPGPNQEYLAIVIDDIPVFDPVYSNLSTYESVVGGKWKIAYVVTDKIKSDILVAADNVKRVQVGLVVPAKDFAETCVTLLAALIREGKTKFTPDEQPMADAIISQAAKLISNRTKIKLDKATINLGGKPDLKTGWSVPSP